MADVVSTERIWEKVPIARTSRSAKLLRFRPGQIVPEAEAKRLNVKADGTQSSVPTAAEIIPEVDATTSTAPAKKAATKKAVAKKTGAKKGTAKKAAPRR
jgi:topoisomerase IA-like protein